MDAASNPYAPGAGTPPPILAGRDEILARTKLALSRVKNGFPERSFIAVGLRGVGKTVIMNEVQKIADQEFYNNCYIEAYDGIDLPKEIVSKLRTILMKLSRTYAASAYVAHAIKVFKSFAGAFRVKYQDFEVSITPEHGVADSGDITSDLTDLFVAVGEAARNHKTAVAMIIDEIQYLSIDHMGAMIMALHRCNQKKLPFIIFGAGLPQLRGKMGEAKSYVERLFDFPEIDALQTEDAQKAIVEPALAYHVNYDADALAEIIDVTRGYPYFIQEWGHSCWLKAPQSPITKADVKEATSDALSRLDNSFFRVRLDRMTPTEKKYMRALAELGPGSHRSGDVAVVYGAAVNSVAPYRSALIAKGMLYSPAHGDTAFTVPLFDAFMRREMPNFKSSDGDSSACE